MADDAKEAAKAYTATLLGPGELLHSPTYGVQEIEDAFAAGVEWVLKRTLTFSVTSFPFSSLLGQTIKAVNADDVYNGQCASVMIATREGGWLVVQPEISLSADHRSAQARLQVTVDK